jgi:hypothetical protein
MIRISSFIFTSALSYWMQYNFNIYFYNSGDYDHWNINSNNNFSLVTIFNFKINLYKFKHCLIFLIYNFLQSSMNYAYTKKNH